MNSLTTPFVRNFVNNPVIVFLQATIGASGVATLRGYGVLPTGSYGPLDADTGGFQGIYTIARVSAGIYDVTFGGYQDPDDYNQLLQATYTISNASGIPTACAMGIVSGSSDVTASPAVVRVKFADYAGVAIELASGDLLLLQFTLRNSSAS